MPEAQARQSAVMARQHSPSFEYPENTRYNIKKIHVALKLIDIVYSYIYMIYYVYRTKYCTLVSDQTSFQERLKKAI